MTGVSPIDRRIGERIRQRRLELGLTQHELATTLDCSYQQIQKFENGGNRISAAQLHALARRLEVPVGWFFGEDAGTAIAAASLEEHGGRQRTAIDLARSFGRIGHQEVRHAVAALVRAIEERQDGEPQA